MTVPKDVLAAVGTEARGERGREDDLDVAVGAVWGAEGDGLAGAGGHHGRGARGAELVLPRAG